MGKGIQSGLYHNAINFRKISVFICKKVRRSQFEKPSCTLLDYSSSHHQLNSSGKQGTVIIWLAKKTLGPETNKNYLTQPNDWTMESTKERGLKWRGATQITKSEKKGSVFLRKFKELALMHHEEQPTPRSSRGTKNLDNTNKKRSYAGHHQLFSCLRCPI